MNEVKHTAGPWVAERTLAPRGWIVSRKDGQYDVAIVRDGSGLPENEANARLIAAAPEMLEALKAAKELADVMEGLSSGRSDDEWIWAAQEKINFAIAKAEGKV